MTFPRSQVEEAYYKSLILSRRRRKAATSTPNIATETVREDTRDCRVIPCEPCAAVGGALIALPILGVGDGEAMIVWYEWQARNL